jgi:hypothetical protein
MTETSLRDGFREVRDQARPSELNPKLEEAVQNQALLPHLLSLEVVLKALAIGAVTALILFVLISPIFAGIGLMVAFFGAWFGLATISYGKAEERRTAEQNEDEDEGE